MRKTITARPGFFPLILFFMFLVGLSRIAWASGYRPFFAEASKVAKVIVEGKVTEAWDPRTSAVVTKGSFTESFETEGRAYFMKIERVFKGDVKVGDEIVLWDRYYNSTAGYAVNVGAKNLMFLIPAERSDFEKKNLEFRTKQEIYQPIRTLSKYPDNPAWDEGYDADIYLLNLTLINPPKDIKATYTNILKTMTNPDVLNYVINQWPGELTEEDKVLFKATIEKFKGDGSITRPALEKLQKAGEVSTDDKVVELLKSDDILEQSQGVQMVNEKNITSVQEILFDCFLNKKCLNSTTSYRHLAKYAPEYFKSKLRQVDLPFWKLIPCLQELKINGSAVGKSDYPPEILGIDSYVISQAGDIYRGGDSSGEAVSFTMALQKVFNVPDWEKALPLFVPLLEKSDSPARKMAVALLRTYGVNVQKEKDKYVVVVPVVASKSFPIQIRLQATKPVYKVNEPIEVIMIETALSDGIWASFRGDLEWEFDAGEAGTGSAGGGLFDIGKKISLPMEDFVELKKGQEISSKQDVGWFLPKRPGVYRLYVIKAFPYDGDTVGLDAWTGAIFSEPIEIKIE